MTATLMTKAEACEYLGISQSTMAALMREKKIPVVRITARSHPRFLRESLDKWVTARESQEKTVERGGYTLRKKRA